MLNTDIVNQIGAVATGYFAGLEAAKQQYAGLAVWEPFVRVLANRYGQLTYQRIVKPIPTLLAVPEVAEPLHEAVGAFIFGLNSSVVYNSGKVLELTLGAAFERDEQKPRPKKLDDLVNWLASKNAQDKPLASSI